MTTSRRLVASLSRTLEAKAEQATSMLTDEIAADVGDTGTADTTGALDGLESLDAMDALRFDPARPSRVPAAILSAADDVVAAMIGPTRRDGLALSPRRPHWQRRLLLPAAAALLVALVGAGALALRDSHQGQRDDADTVTIGSPPDGWLVPAWVPEGMELWSVEWYASPSGSQGSQEPGTIAQLFGDPEGGRAMYVTSSRYEFQRGRYVPVTVRGGAGRAGRTWDVAEADVGEGIAWEERGVALTALYKGMSLDEAVAALDSLVWRSDDPADGFAPPDGGPLPLRAEVGEGQLAARDASVFYSDGPPALAPDAGRLGLMIYTTAGDAVLVDYLEAWYRQGRSAGGGQRPLTQYEEGWHHLSVLWPDGRSVRIAPTGAPRSQLPSREVLERVARSMTVVTETDLTALRGTAEANVESLPALVTAETRIGTVEVHGDGSFLQLCLRRPGAPRPACRADDLGGLVGEDGAALATASWTVDGTWYVAVVSRGQELQVLGGRGEAGPDPADGELPVEATTVGDWTIRLVEPPPDVELVCTNDGIVMKCADDRPA